MSFAQAAEDWDAAVQDLTQRFRDLNWEVGKLIKENALLKKENADLKAKQLTAEHNESSYKQLAHEYGKLVNRVAEAREALGS